MNNLHKLIGISAIFINVAVYSAIEKKYHCLSGQLFNGHILEANLYLEKYKQSYLTTLEWNNHQVGHGRLRPSQQPDLYIEQWTGTRNDNQSAGISTWKFEGKTINIKYNYIDEKTGKFFQGEINCRV